jgi:hypothetical protein
MVTLVVVVAGVTCIRLYQIGDSGAKATWQRTRLVTSTEH